MYKLFLNSKIQAFHLENTLAKYLGCLNQNNLPKHTFPKHFTWPKSEYLEKKGLAMFTLHSPIHYVVFLIFFRMES